MGKKLKLIGFIMLAIAIAFIIFALNHPELSFPWSNTITYIVYGVYLLVMIIFLIIPIEKKQRK